MKRDRFEQQLQGLPLRPVPPGWRNEILQAARDAQPATSPASHLQEEDSRVSPFPIWNWRAWLWPHPAAWAGLAAVWLCLLGVHLTPGPAAAANIAANSNRDLQNALLSQRRELARLLDSTGDFPPATKPPPGPRSDRLAPPSACRPPVPASADSLAFLPPHGARHESTT